MLFWRLGGARVASIAHRSLGLPSVSTLRHQTLIAPLIASPSHPKLAEVEANINAWFESIAQVVKDYSVVHQVLMLDELKVEERPRWDNKTNQILEICREHGTKANLEYTSRMEAEMLVQAIDDGIVHLATEVMWV